MANPRNPEQDACEPEDTPDPEDGCADQTDPDSPKCCEDLPKGPVPPTLTLPRTCAPTCDCPSSTPPTRTCFDRMIARQDNIANRAERAKAIKAALEEMLKNANAAKQTYTRQKYDDFKKRWEALDKEIVAAVDIVTCNIRCWWCVIECHICPLIYRIRWIEERLYGDGTLIGDAHSLTDLEYWHTRNVAAKQRAFDRIQLVLGAWKDPAATIEAALKANELAVGSIRSMKPADALLKLFFEILPLHVAIAPRDIGSPRNIPTAIDAKYLDLCGDCDPELEPDDCCGPDVGLPGARQRLVPPQAFIVDPDRYFDLLCCIVTERFEPAKKQLETAQEMLGAISAELTLLKAELTTRLTTPFADYKANIAVPIDCSKYTRKEGQGQQPSPSPAQQPTDQSAS